MALSMPRPFATKSGSYYLNVKVPKALRAAARGLRVTLPVADEQVAVSVTDKVYMSLRTKEAKVAKVRFPIALDALNGFFASLAEPPQALGRAQVVALAGEIYKDAVNEIDRDNAIADAVESCRDEMAEDVAHYVRQGAPESSAELEAAIDSQDERALMAWGLKHGDPFYTHEQLLEMFFGPLVDQKLAEHRVRIDATSRLKLLRAAEKMGQAFIETAERRLKNLDYSDPVGLGLPVFEIPSKTSASSPSDRAVRKSGRMTVEMLFEAWKQAKGTKKAPSTVRRYAPSLASLQTFWGPRDVSALTQADIWEWALAREQQPGVTASTINKNDLVAISSVLGWAASFPGGNRLKTNPVNGVKLEVDRQTVTRKKYFEDGEIRAILTVARNAKPKKRYPKASASRRWAPWICAYTGARIQEVCWLSKSDIRKEDGIWIIHFPMTKTNVARKVPIHPALVDEGLLDFARAAPEGFLFVGDQPQKNGATRSQQEQRASELAEWVQNQVKLEEGVSPNHGWRHTFVTRAEEANISKRFSNAITGHNHNKDVSDGYFGGRMSALKTRMDRYPRYGV